MATIEERHEWGKQSKNLIFEGQLEDDDALVWPDSRKAVTCNTPVWGLGGVRRKVKESRGSGQVVALYRSQEKK